MQTHRLQAGDDQALKVRPGTPANPYRSRFHNRLRATNRVSEEDEAQWGEVSTWLYTAAQLLRESYTKAQRLRTTPKCRSQIKRQRTYEPHGRSRMPPRKIVRRTTGTRHGPIPGS
jgi:hypothetical protein